MALQQTARPQLEEGAGAEASRCSGNSTEPAKAWD
jgi:hypothetical protein